MLKRIGPGLKPTNAAHVRPGGVDEETRSPRMEVALFACSLDGVLGRSADLTRIYDEPCRHLALEPG